jgi:hypothetical protein
VDAFDFNFHGAEIVFQCAVVLQGQFDRLAGRYGDRSRGKGQVNGFDDNFLVVAIGGRFSRFWGAATSSQDEGCEEEKKDQQFFHVIQSPFG